MQDNGHSPYTPIPMHVLHAYYESTDHSLKTVELSFDYAADSREFFQAFNPGQFCLLSVAGKGESLVCFQPPVSAPWQATQAFTPAYEPSSCAIEAVVTEKTHGARKIGRAHV